MSQVVLRSLAREAHHMLPVAVRDAVAAPIRPITSADLLGGIVDGSRALNDPKHDTMVCALEANGLYWYVMQHHLKKIFQPKNIDTRPGTGEIPRLLVYAFLNPIGELDSSHLNPVTAASANSGRMLVMACLGRSLIHNAKTMAAQVRQAMTAERLDRCISQVARFVGVPPLSIEDFDSHDSLASSLVTSDPQMYVRALDRTLSSLGTFDCPDTLYTSIFLYDKIERGGAKAQCDTQIASVIGKCSNVTTLRFQTSRHQAIPHTTSKLLGFIELFKNHPIAGVELIHVGDAVTEDVVKSLYVFRSTLTSLHISGADQLQTLDITPFEKLRALNLSDMRMLSNISGLLGLRSLTILRLNNMNPNGQAGQFYEHCSDNGSRLHKKACKATRQYRLACAAKAAAATDPTNAISADAGFSSTDSDSE